MKNKNTWNDIVKPIVVLSVIAMVVSLALAATNMFTAPVIEANQKATTMAAYVQVLPGTDAAALEEVTGYQTSNITGAVKTADGQYAFKAEETGFDGGIVTVIMGFDASGTSTGIWVDASTQTAGIGSRVGEADFLTQFTGVSGTANVAMGENGLDGLTGATFSSKALFAAINDCINCYGEVALGQAATVVEEYVNPTKEEAIEQLAPGATAAGALPTDECTELYANDTTVVLVAEAQGIESTVTVATAFDSATGAITGVWVDASGETEGLGTMCMEPDFTGSFVGAADVSAVDGVSGATVTSDAVKTAVEACVNGFAAM